MISPGIYLQRFRPRIYNLDDKTRYTVSDLHYGWKWGLGGEASIRYKASRLVDVHLKSGVVWTTNNKFDGIRSQVTGKRNFYNNWEAGINFKLGGGKKKKEHLIYASTRRFVTLPKRECPVPVWIRYDTLTVETPPQVIEVEKVVEVAVHELPELPAVHFSRGSMDIDARANEYGLQFIISVLKEFTEFSFHIIGFADHTGSDRINETVSFGRAEALRNYLIDNGIDVSRITDLIGMGKDPDKTGDAAFSSEARRAVIVKN